MGFILPVLNRRHCILRAIDSCLACATARVRVRVWVIDGGSADGTRQLVAERYAGEERVRLLDQPADSKGFMAACFFGVQGIDTDLATFMYSDDVLSPEFARLAEALADDPESPLALGYGRQAAEAERLVFPAPLRIRAVDSEQVLQAFFGRPDRLEGRSLPVSPVCCLVRADALRAWAAHVRRFVSGSDLRQHAMIRLAGGQDLLVYLVALLEGCGQARLADGVLAQLTASENSITKTGNRAGQLLAGYWLARVWGLEKALEQGRVGIAAPMAGYVLAVWVYIVLGMMRRLDMHWLMPVIREGLGVLGLTLRRGMLPGVLWAAMKSVVARWRMRAREVH